MKQLLKVLFFGALCLAITACGGGGGGGGGGSTSSANPNTPIGDIDPKNIPANRQAEWDEYAEKFEASSTNLVAGLYNVTTTDSNGKKDVGYIYIDAEAKASSDELVVTAYNYMLDDIDAEGSCYRYASGEMYNAKLNSEPGMGGKGSTVKWVNPWNNDLRISKFEVEVDGKKLSWVLDKFINITGIEYDSLSSANHLIVSSSGTKLSVTANKEILGAVNISIIKANMCSGDQVNESNIGSNKYEGLYDTTLMEGAKKYESYLYIDLSGKMTAYKYMGDGYDASSNQNCYKISPFYNTELNGKGLSYDKLNNRLSFNLDDLTLFWNMNSNGEIISVGSDSVTSGVKYENQARSLSISSLKAQGLTITDLQNSICK